MKSPQNFTLRDLPADRVSDAITQEATFVPLSNDEKTWKTILNLLPSGLQKALQNEIKLGNRVTSIQYGDWPQKGSIVISLAHKFKGNYEEKNPYGVTFRTMNDPHYWMADIHTIVGGVEHLIIY